VLATVLIRQHHHGLGCPTVVDVKSAKHALAAIGLDGSMTVTGSAGMRWPSPWCGATFVEIALVLAQQTGQMLVVDEPHMVEYLSACAAHKALGHGVHIRRSNRRSDHLRADALRRAVECRTKLVVAIPQQHGRRVPIHRGVAQLLRRPRLGRVARRGDVDHLPRRHVDDEERVDLAEQEITRRPRRQPPRTEEQLQPINEVERGPLAATSQDVDLVAKHRVLAGCGFTTSGAAGVRRP